MDGPPHLLGLSVRVVSTPLAHRLFEAPLLHRLTAAHLIADQGVVDALLQSTVSGGGAATSFFDGEGVQRELRTDCSPTDALSSEPRSALSTKGDRALDVMLQRTDLFSVSIGLFCSRSQPSSSSQVSATSSHTQSGGR